MENDDLLPGIINDWESNVLKIAENIRRRRRPNVTWRWVDESVCFDCPCGTKEIILSEGGAKHECDCGRVYEYIAYVIVRGEP